MCQLLVLSTNMAKTYKPGQIVPKSSQVEIVGPKGGRTGIERTVVRGEPFPPTQRSGQSYLIIDRTKHGKGGLNGKRR